MFVLVSDFNLGPKAMELVSPKLYKTLLLSTTIIPSLTSQSSPYCSNRSRDSLQGELDLSITFGY